MRKFRSGTTKYAPALFVALGLSAWQLPAASAQSDDDMPTTLPDDDYRPPQDQATDMPATLPDDGPPPESEGAPAPIRFEASINAALSVPIAHNPDIAGFGLAVTYGVGWGEIPLTFGLDFINVGSLGDANSHLDLTLMDTKQSAEQVMNTRLMHFDAWLRLQPAHFPVRPYAEGFFGAQLFQGHWLLRTGTAESERAQGDDWTRNFGWGVGVEFSGLLSRAGDMSLTLGMRRVYGGTIKASRSLAIAGESVPWRYEAATSVLLFTLGIGLHYELADPHPRSGMGY